MPTSKLQEQVASEVQRRFPFLSVLENRRPEWLTDQHGRRLELDLYLEELGLAIEVQGVQHFSYVEHFHGSAEGFEDQKERDNAKRAACKAHGIVLIEICESSEVPALMDAIDRRLMPQRKLLRKKAVTLDSESLHRDTELVKRAVNLALDHLVETGQASTLTVTVKISGKASSNAARVFVRGPLVLLDTASRSMR